MHNSYETEYRFFNDNDSYTQSTSTEEKKTSLRRKKKRSGYKPWMSYVNKYSLLSNQQRDSLELFFINNQVRLTRKNIRSIAGELRISYKKIINYIYERNYEHLLVKEGPEENLIDDIKRIRRDLVQSWEVYEEVCKIFQNEIGR